MALALPLGVFSLSTGCVVDDGIPIPCESIVDCDRESVCFEGRCAKTTDIYFQAFVTVLDDGQGGCPCNSGLDDCEGIRPYYEALSGQQLLHSSSSLSGTCWPDFINDDWLDEKWFYDPRNSLEVIVRDWISSTRVDNFCHRYSDDWNDDDPPCSPIAPVDLSVGSAVFYGDWDNRLEVVFQPYSLLNP